MPRAEAPSDSPWEHTRHFLSWHHPQVLGMGPQMTTLLNNHFGLISRECTGLLFTACSKPNDLILVGGEGRAQSRQAAHRRSQWRFEGCAFPWGHPFSPRCKYWTFKGHVLKEQDVIKLSFIASILRCTKIFLCVIKLRSLKRITDLCISDLMSSSWLYIFFQNVIDHRWMSLCPRLWESLHNDEGCLGRRAACKQEQKQEVHVDAERREGRRQRQRSQSRKGKNKRTETSVAERGLRKRLSLYL